MLIEVCKHVVTNMLEININVLSTSGPCLNSSAFFAAIPSVSNASATLTLSSGSAGIEAAS
jgi:hypothetical protein